MRDDAEFCNYMDIAFYSRGDGTFQGTSDAASERITGYLVKDENYANRILILRAWDGKRNEAARRGAVAVYDDAVLEYAKLEMRR